jgi:low affinity Fe/Cu permease
MRFDDLAVSTSKAAAKSYTFLLAFGTVLVWAVTGPVFHYSDTWQLVINTGTTIVTFLMAFLIQNDAVRRDLALHVKLDELIRVSAARNEFVGIDEHMGEEDLRRLRAQASR